MVQMFFQRLKNEKLQIAWNAFLPKFRVDLSFVQGKTVVSKFRKNLKFAKCQFLNKEKSQFEKHTVIFSNGLSRQCFRRRHWFDEIKSLSGIRTYVHTYVRIPTYVTTLLHVSTYVRRGYVRTHACVYARTYVRTYVGRYVRTYIRMYVGR